MYEFTMGGMWFRWSALDRSSKRLAGGSLVLSMISAAAFGLALGRYSYELGVCAGSGRWQHCAPEGVSLSPLVAGLVVLTGIGSAVLWALFSARQDEMFNRVQNWALGTAGAWTGAAALIWTMLAFGNVVPMLPVWTVAALFMLLLLVTWTIAVRRWAY